MKQEKPVYLYDQVALWTAALAGFGIGGLTVLLLVLLGS